MKRGTNQSANKNDDARSTRRALLTATAAATVGGSAGCVSVTTPADIAAATQPDGNLDYVVGSPWLAENRTDVIILDARPQRDFRAERVYGARRIGLDPITRQRTGDSGREPDLGAIATAFGERGVQPSDDVVVYGQSVGARVTRVVFALKAIGHRGDLHVLNGGLDGWNGRVGTGPAGSPDPVAYEPDPDPSLWVTREWVADRVGSFNDDGPGLVDVRATEAFLGNDTAAESDLDRHGHIAGAMNVHWLGNLARHRLGAPGDLFQLYNQRADLSTDETIVVYSEENINATQTWLTLRALGYPDVRVYDGGFREWANVSSNRGRYPVETKTDAVIETEGGGIDEDSGDFSCTG